MIVVLALPAGSEVVKTRPRSNREYVLDPRCLAHSLTLEEREQFDRDGYILVEDALTAEQIETYTRAIDRIYAQRATGKEDSLDIPGRLQISDFLTLDPAFIELIDNPRVFPKVWGILGWNLFLYHTHFQVTPPVTEAERPRGRTFVWHQDSPGITRDTLELEVPPRLSLKVFYHLTDVSEPGKGNLGVIPGSHLKRHVESPRDGMGQPDGAIEILARPGAALYFDRRLWHAATPNYSKDIRKTMVYGYSYRWLRNRDPMTVTPEMLENASPIRRQLLGAATSDYRRYEPIDEDVPLKLWLMEHQAETAAAWASTIFEDTSDRKR